MTVIVASFSAQGPMQQHCGAFGYGCHNEAGIESQIVRGSADKGKLLAAFAAGCLGLDSPAKVGNRLGLMGSASFEETLRVLQHLETLARQRAQKLANVRSASPLNGHGDSPINGTCSGLGGQFEEALLEAVQSKSVSELFELLPRDVGGRADLCQIFGMGTNTGRAAADGLSFAFSAEFAEFAADLPATTADMRAEAERRLLDGPATEERWELDASAINVIRSFAACPSAASASQALASSALLVALADRCGSRRPALAKAALSAVLELASCDQAGEADSWRGAGQRLLDACLGALRSTKVVARIAERALSGLADRLVASCGLDGAAAMLASCASQSARAKPARPQAAAAALRLLQPLVPELPASFGVVEANVAVNDAVKIACEDVLATRALSTAFSAARAVLRALPTQPTVQVDEEEPEERRPNESRTATPDAEEILAPLACSSGH